jgi:fructose-1,6-bisphosphatase/sedoheptulose 1,7-bisphosphatase-like protein
VHDVLKLGVGPQQAKSKPLYGVDVPVVENRRRICTACENRSDELIVVALERQGSNDP